MPSWFWWWYHELWNSKIHSVRCIYLYFQGFIYTKFRWRHESMWHRSTASSIYICLLNVIPKNITKTRFVKMGGNLMTGIDCFNLDRSLISSFPNLKICWTMHFWSWKERSSMYLHKGVSVSVNNNCLIVFFSIWRLSLNSSTLFFTMISKRKMNVYRIGRFHRAGNFIMCFFFVNFLNLHC